MKKVLSVFFLSSILFFSLGDHAFAKGQVIRIALWKLPLNVPAMAAVKEQEYEKAFSGERKVEYIELPSGPKQIQAMAAGALDVSEGIGAPAALVGAANGADIRIVGVTSRSPKAFAVMALDPEIKTIAGLKGKKVAGLRGSVVHQLFLMSLKEAGMRESDVEFFPMALHAAASALVGGRVDAALLVGLEAVQAERAGARVLTDGEGRLDGLSLIVVRRGFLEENPQAVREYLLARQKIAARLEKDPDSFLPLVQKETGLSEKEAKKLMKLYDFDNTVTAKDIKELHDTAIYLEKEKFIKQLANIDALVVSVIPD